MVQDERPARASWSRPTPPAGMGVYSARLGPSRVSL